jgi:ATP-binding cassette subfamily C (CFTR/MRP) protein 4
MVQKGTYTEFLKSGVDFGSLLKKENEEAEPSTAPGTPTLRKRTFSEASIWSQQSSRPSLKDGAPEGQDVSSSPAPWLSFGFTDLVIRSVTLLVASAFVLELDLRL